MAASEDAWGYLLELETMRLYPLTVEESRIGRLRENNIRLTSTRVSRRHAVIRKTAEGTALEDVGSSNGSTVNGERIGRGRPVTLQAGDVLRLADTRLLFHETIDLLWEDELRHRFLGRFVRLKVALPQDLQRKAFGKLEYVGTESEALLDPAKGEVEMTYPDFEGLRPTGGFGVDTLAFVGQAAAEGAVLELSLWGVDQADRMVSRRALYSRLKHTRLRIIVEAETGFLEGTGRPMFPGDVLSSVLEIVPMDPRVFELALKMSRSLTVQERAVAYHDAALTLGFRHRGEPKEASLAVLAAECQGKWVEAWLAEQRGGLSNEERQRLSTAIEEGLGLLAAARERGAKGKEVAEAEQAITRAGKRLEMEK